MDRSEKSLILTVLFELSDFSKILTTSPTGKFGGKNMLRFEVKTISPISISDIFFNSTGNDNIYISSQIVGYIAGALVVSYNIPQLVRMIKTKSTDDVDMLSLFFQLTLKLKLKPIFILTHNLGKLKKTL